MQITQSVFLRLLIVFLCVGMLSQGCVTKKKIFKIFVNDNYCNDSPVPFSVRDSLLSKQIDTDTVVTKTIKERFSGRVRSVAADLGILSLLNEMVLLEKIPKRTLEQEFQLLKVQSFIEERINLAHLEVSYVLSELECEQDRGTELLNYINQYLSKKNKNYTIASIFSAVIPAILVSIINTSQESPDPYMVEGITSGGAITSGFFAYKVLTIKKKEYFYHRNNHIADIVKNPQKSKIYPPMIWHFLTRELETTTENAVVRDLVLARWRELKLLDDQNPTFQPTLQLLVGEGGEYDGDTILTRITMLDLLEIEISAMKEELIQLKQEIIFGRK